MRRQEKAAKDVSHIETNAASMHKTPEEAAQDAAAGDGRRRALDERVLVEAVRMFQARALDERLQLLNFEGAQVSVHLVDVAKHPTSAASTQGAPTSRLGRTHRHQSGKSLRASSTSADPRQHAVHTARLPGSMGN